MAAVADDYDGNVLMRFDEDEFELPIVRLKRIENFMIANNMMPREPVVRLWYTRIVQKNYTRAWYARNTYDNENNFIEYTNHYKLVGNPIYLRERCGILECECLGSPEGEIEHEYIELERVLPDEWFVEGRCRFGNNMFIAEGPIVYSADMIRLFLRLGSPFQMADKASFTILGLLLCGYRLP